MKEKNIIIIAAMPEELSSIEKIWPSNREHKLENSVWYERPATNNWKLWTAVCGIKACKIKELFNYASRNIKADPVILVGCSGALKSDIKALSPLIASNFINGDIRENCYPDKSLTNYLKAVDSTIKSGIFGTASIVLKDETMKKEFYKLTGADVVEMEGAIVACELAKYDYRFASIRWVLDGNEESLEIKADTTEKSIKKLNFGEISARLKQISEKTAEFVKQLLDSNDYLSG